MWIALVIIGLGINIALWVCCRAASKADDATQEWNKNWIGQKFPKEDPKTKK